MSDEITAVVDLNSGEFCPQGHDLDDRFVRVSLPRNPDHLREHYSGKTDDPIAPKSPEAIVTALEKQAAASIELPIKAVLLRGLTVRLGRGPTLEEIDTELAAYVVVYKGLL